MNKIILFLIFILNGVSLSAQTEELGCATKDPDLIWEAKLQEYISANKKSKNINELRRNDFIIPVIFHVIHGGEAMGTYPNILAEQINSQLTILNQDFSGNAYNASNYPDNAFVNWAINQNIPQENLDELGRVKISDFNIQFCLAVVDAEGNLLNEPGIERLNYVLKGWQNPNLFETQNTMRSYLDSVIKPQSIWDVTRYLNVWITDKSNALTYAGVSSVPPLSGLTDLPNNTSDSTDGIWCFAKAVGSYALFPEGNYISQFIDGRTLTHEVGHYLGLRHIWGDAVCGNDFCDDTPPAAGENTGMPTYPHNSGSCSTPSNSPDGEMFMNFMDYTRGPYKFMFTTDQRTRAQTVMLNSPFRNQLGTHGLCSSPNALAAQGSELLYIYPNPTNDLLQISYDDDLISRVEIINQFGLSVRTFIASKISIADLPSGVYFVKVEGKQQTYVRKIIKL